MTKLMGIPPPVRIIAQGHCAQGLGERDIDRQGILVSASGLGETDIGPHRSPTPGADEDFHVHNDHKDIVCADIASLLIFRIVRAFGPNLWKGSRIKVRVSIFRRGGFEITVALVRHLEEADNIEVDIELPVAGLLVVRGNVGSFGLKSRYGRSLVWRREISRIASDA